MKKIFYIILPLLILSILSIIIISQVKEKNRKITIASEKEPGEKMIVTGIVYDEDGITPVGGIAVYIYHTNAEGIYGKGDDLLKGTMITNSDGRYEYSTIKPGSYPGSRNPAHVHYKITGKGYPEQWFELRFEGDPYISETVLKSETAKENFSQIQKLVKDSYGVLKCKMDVKLKK
jgi:protocatechuate 3,4-dioxygenase beta subunit